jgi:hypothetical protein
MFPPVLRENQDQDPRIHVLGNIQEVVDAAETRVDDVGNQVLEAYQEALRQSNLANQTLAARLTQMGEQLEVMMKRIDRVESLRETQNTALIARIDALEARLVESEGKNKALEEAMAKSKVVFDSHTHVAHSSHQTGFMITYSGVGTSIPNQASYSRTQ